MEIVLSVLWGIIAGSYIGLVYYKASAGTKKARLAVGISAGIMFGIICAMCALGS